MGDHNAPLISVIIPIYNVENYLDKCLSSVRSQSLEDIEILCIDDCSPDESYKIVEKHASVDPRVSLIRHTCNLGLGGARNTGIREAKSDYIASVDSDDYIEPGMLEGLYRAAEDGAVDIVCCGFDSVDECGEVIFSSEYEHREIINTDNSINIFYTVNPSFWNKLWKRSLFIDNNIFFPEEIYFEDVPTTPRLLSKSKRIKIIEGQFYKYVQRDGSITAGYGDKHILDYFRGFEIIDCFLIENGLKERYRNEFYTYINNCMKYHANIFLEKVNKNKDVEKYLRLMMMVKLSFIEYSDVLRNMYRNELLNFLGQHNNILVRKGNFFLKQETDKEHQIATKTKQYKAELFRVKILQEKLSTMNSLSANYRNDYLESEKKVKTLQKKLSTMNSLSANYRNDYLESEKKIKSLQEKLSKMKTLLAESRNDFFGVLKKIDEGQDELNLLKDESISVKTEAVHLRDNISKLQQEITDVRSNSLNFVQFFGISIYAFFVLPFIDEKLRNKLNKYPIYYFIDSKSKFTRMFGKFFGFISSN